MSQLNKAVILIFMGYSIGFWLRPLPMGIYLLTTTLLLGFIYYLAFRWFKEKQDAGVEVEG